MTDNIPYSLALRIVRICSETDDRDKRLDELKVLLLSRNYRLGMINAAIERAKSHFSELRVRPYSNLSQALFGAEFDCSWKIFTS